MYYLSAPTPLLMLPAPKPPKTKQELHREKWEAYKAFSWMIGNPFDYLAFNIMSEGLLTKEDIKDFILNRLKYQKMYDPIDNRVDIK